MDVNGERAGPEQIAAVYGCDPAKPNAARVYDYLLGGKDNFAAAVRRVAEQGVRQFVDIGAGLPTTPNVHECARRAVPGARVAGAWVAYVDNDPVVVTYARALLATDDLVTVINAGASDHAAIFGAAEFGSLIDLSEPICVIFVSMLHFLPAADADAAVAGFRERMAPGSYLVISAGHDNVKNIPVRNRVQAADGRDTVLTGRTPADIAGYFYDFDLVPPGLVPLTEWPLEVPDGPHSPLEPPSPSAAVAMLAGIGRKRG